MGNEPSLNSGDYQRRSLEGLAIALETASYVANLVTTNPDGGDQRSTADDHIRLIKAALVRTFPKVDGAISLSSAQVMYLNDLSASVQLQLNQLRDGSATANNAVNSRFANSASLALYANSASYAALAATANSASYAALAGTATLAVTANSASFAVLAGRASTADSASFAVLAGRASTADSASYAALAGSATLLSGLSPTDAPTGNTIVQRNSSGQILASYYNQGSGDNENPSVGQIPVITAGDGYFRKAGVSHVGSYMEARNITGRSGTTKTLSSSAPTGGSNGDIWYQI